MTINNTAISSEQESTLTKLKNKSLKWNAICTPTCNTINLTMKTTNLFSSQFLWGRWYKGKKTRFSVGSQSLTFKSCVLLIQLRVEVSKLTLDACFHYTEATFDRVQLRRIGGIESADFMTILNVLEVPFGSVNGSIVSVVNGSIVNS